MKANSIELLIDPIIDLTKSNSLTIVAISGAADTGKTSLANELSEALQIKRLNCQVIGTDSFLLERKERKRLGWSGYDPKSFKEKECLKALQCARSGEVLKFYPYNSLIGNNHSEFTVIHAADVLIVEGIHAFHPLILTETNLKIFITSDTNTLRQLRFHANVNKRGVSVSEAKTGIEQDLQAYLQFLQPLQTLADICIHIDQSYSITQIVLPSQNEQKN